MAGEANMPVAVAIKMAIECARVAGVATNACLWHKYMPFCGKHMVSLQRATVSEWTDPDTGEVVQTKDIVVLVKDATGETSVFGEL